MNKYAMAMAALLISLSAIAQSQKYWVFLEQKDTTGYMPTQHLSAQCIFNRQMTGLSTWQYTDIPVQSMYIDSLRNYGFETGYPSKWLNAIAVVADPQSAAYLLTRSWVTDVVAMDTRFFIAQSEWTDAGIDSGKYELRLQQMEAWNFVGGGPNGEDLNGKNMTLGVIDAGFTQAYSVPYLKHVFANNQIKGVNNVLGPNKDSTKFFETTNDGETHGREALKFIVGKTKFKQFGLATDANIYLARTEDVLKEYRGEEDMWIRAMEWMDSLGVRLINTSLGYCINMTDSNDNYKITEMNGKTTRIAKAAQIAVDEKGILLCVSAGNEGDNPSWGIVGSPADAEGVLSVGATNTLGAKAFYSSMGPDYVSYLKPNVSCFSPNGTSFSSPALCGYVACVWQYNPSMNNKQIKTIIEKSGHLYPYGNNYLGYGIPKSSRALALMKDTTANVSTVEVVDQKGSKYKLVLANVTAKNVIVWHKKNATHVITENTYKITESIRSKGVLVIQKPKKVTVAQTTIDLGDAVIEIKWQ